MSKLYKITARIRARVGNNWDGRHEVQFIYGTGIGGVSFRKRGDAERALDAMAREFGWEEV